MDDNVTLKRLVSYLNKYGLTVIFTKLDDDNIAIAELSQHKIVVNETARDVLGMIFTIAHLFGHYIQFSNYDKYKSLISRVKEEPKPLILDKKFKQDFFNYEKEAFQIGKKLLQQIIKFTNEDDRKYQIFFETDFDLFWEYLIKGTQQSPQAFNEELKKRYRFDKNCRIPLEPLNYQDSRVNLHGVNLIVY